jgi:hypothetical protein
MPRPGFSLVPLPQRISGREAVEMVTERFKASGCTEAEAIDWLTDQVRQRKVKLQWTAGDPELFGGLHLTGEGITSVPRLRPSARTIDEVDFGVGLAIDALNWSAGELWRRLRFPKSVARDRSSSEYEALRRLYEGSSGASAFAPIEPEEWVTSELSYQFTIRRASLTAVLDRASVPLGTVRMPLMEAGAVLADRFNVSPQMGLGAIIDAAAAERIEVYGKRVSGPPRREDRIDPGVWMIIARGDAELSTDAVSAEFGDGTWSDPYVFRGDLERLAREMAADSGGGEIDTTTGEDRAENKTGTRPSVGGRRSGRVAADFWPSAKAEAMRWLQDNGFPAANDGNQAKLERHILDWLGGRGCEASETTVRRHAQKCIACYRAQIGAEDQNSST